MTVARAGQHPVELDGQAVEAFEGETIAGLMLRLHRSAMRRTLKRGDTRGYFCGMGSCYECIVEVNGRQLQGCLTYTRPGMRIRTGVPS